MSRHNGPSEQSSKQPVSVLRTVTLPENTKAKRYNDPRFDRSMGHFNPDLFKKSFNFIDDLQAKEMAMIRAQLRDRNLPESKREQLQALLQRAQSKKHQIERDEKRKTLVKEWKQQERELVAKGLKAPYHLKKSDLRRMEMVSEYKQAQAKGTVEKLIEKRRKKKATKQHTQLPFKHD